MAPFSIIFNSSDNLDETQLDLLILFEMSFARLEALGEKYLH